jgi:hypothetical protein
MRTNNGGPAFARSIAAMGTHCSTPNYRIESTGGMSLRAYLAGQALPVLVRAAVSQDVDDFTPALIAREACMYADALIAELEK